MTDQNSKSKLPKISEDRFQQDLDGKTFRIVQPGGRCCESGCSGCELYQYKLENGLPIQNSRLNFYKSFALPKQDEDE